MMRRTADAAVVFHEGFLVGEQQVGDNGGGGGKKVTSPPAGIIAEAGG